jgi:hypothetical protein
VGVTTKATVHVDWQLWILWVRVMIRVRVRVSVGVRVRSGGNYQSHCTRRLAALDTLLSRCRLA